MWDHQEAFATCPEKKIKTCLFLLRPRCLPRDRFLTVLPLLLLLRAEKSPAVQQRDHHPPPTSISCPRPRRGRGAAPKRLPESARQCPGRAASSKSPSSSGRRGGASWDRRAPELLTPWKRVEIPPALQSTRSRGRSLGSRAAGPASLGPWGFASCGAIGTVHTSRPLLRSTPRRGAQPSAHHSSRGISGHGPGAGGKREARAARSSCLGPGRARRSRGFTRAGTAAAWGSHGAARVGRAAPGSLPRSRMLHPECEVARRGNPGPWHKQPATRRRPYAGVSVPTGSLDRWALAPAVSATAAQSSSSLTKKARSTGAGEGDEAGARAHPRAEPPRAPRSRARGPNRALHWRGPRWGLGVPLPSVPRSRGGKDVGDSPLTRKGTRHDHGQPAKSSACILEKLSEDDRRSFVQVVHYFSESLADTCMSDLAPKN